MIMLSEEQEKNAVVEFIDPLMHPGDSTNEIMRACVKQFPYFSEATIFNSILGWKDTAL